jgi:hypothetical protein
LLDKSNVNRQSVNPFYEYKKFEETRKASLNLIEFSQLDRLVKE